MTEDRDTPRPGRAYRPKGGLEAGTLLEGRYRIVRALGEGGVGVVYEATHVRLGRTVAVKVLREHFAIDTMRKRFDREAKALASLSHPNIVAITDYGVASHGVPYIVMELLEGRTLREILDTDGRLRDDRCLRIVRQILSGLDCAHRAGIVHRDLKPGNIFVTREGTEGETVKILDFGFVKVAPSADASGASLSQQGLAFGTIGYMPPEQVTGGETGTYSDVYAVGVVFYEMLTGHKPFSGGLVEMAQAHLSEPVPPLSHFCPGFDPKPELERCLEKALAKTPGERFADAAAFLEAVDALPLPLLPPKAMATAATIPAIYIAEISKVVEATKREEHEQAKARRSVARTVWRWLAVAAATAVLAAAGLAAYSAGWLPAGWLPAGWPGDWHVAIRRPPVDPGDAPPPVEAPPIQDADAAGPPLDAGEADTTVDAERADADDERADATDAGQGTLPDPWARERVPRFLAHSRQWVLRGRVLSARSIRELRDFARTHREDPRPHLVLAQSYLNDGAVTSAIERYELAYSFDGSARGDRRMLGDLVKLAESESVGDRAADLLVDAYGGDALEAVTRALSRSRLNARARRRLEALRERLDQE